MKKFLTACAVIGGITVFVLWYEKRREKTLGDESEAPKVKADNIIAEEEGLVAERKAANEFNTEDGRIVINKDGNVVDKNTAISNINYSSFSGSRGKSFSKDITFDDIYDMERDIEHKRKDYELRNEVKVGLEAVNNNKEESEMTAWENYIDSKLSCISKHEDLKIWTIMAALYGYDWYPSDFQASEERNIINYINNEREKFFGEALDAPITCGELLMYFADEISYHLDVSKANALDNMLGNGEFLVAWNDDISIDDEVLAAAVEEFFVSDISYTGVSVFGSVIDEETDPDFMDWGSQLEIYIGENA